MSASSLENLLQQLTTLAEQHTVLAKDKASAAYTISYDEAGNAFHWYRLGLPKDIIKAAQWIADAAGRLGMITAYNREHLQDPVHEVCYHFEIQGTIINITVLLDSEHHEVPSITSIFANADWHEREMMELYDIAVLNQPNPRRLFLSPELDGGILGEAVPLSIMMNGACTIDLWERILKDRASQENSNQEDTPQKATEIGHE